MNDFGWLWWPNDIWGTMEPKASWNLSYRWGKTPKKKISPRKLVPTGDQTQAHCMTGVHATACSTVIDRCLVLCLSVNCFGTHLAHTFQKEKSPGDYFMQQWARHLGELTREFRNCEALVPQNCMLHTFHQFWHHQGWMATMVFIVHFGLAFIELPTPSYDHTVTHNVGFIHMAQLAVDLCWRLLMSVQKSDNCMSLTVGGRQYQCS